MRARMPERVLPMLASAGPLPEGDAGRWAYEVKWDGVRIIAYVRDGGARLQARSGRDVTARYPEVLDAGGAPDAVLDGEIVAFDPATGLPSFQLLQGRMHLAGSRAIRALAAERPVSFIVFDLLWLDGRSLLQAPYEQRREALAGLGLAARNWQVPGHQVGTGEALLAFTRDRGLEGVLAKRLGCPYHPGRRVTFWRKVKNTRRTVLTIGGWLPGEGRRRTTLGALLVGEPLEGGGLRYAGRVGTGFDEAELQRLLGLLDGLAAVRSPFVGPQPPRLARFVEPALRCEVEFLEWTRTRTVRAPSYKGLYRAGSSRSTVSA